MFIYSYNNGSRGLQALRDAGLEFKIIRAENSKFKGGKNKFVINWGNSVTNEEIEKSFTLNKPSAVAAATNKLTLFNLLKDTDVNIPRFTQNKDEALTWGFPIIIRTKLTGHSGEGCFCIENSAEWDDFNHDNVRLYVDYIPKKREYRVHVFRHSDQYDIQAKAVPKGSVPATYRIQNHGNGFIYARENAKDAPKQVVEQARLALAKTDLDFGAVDIIWNERREKAYVLEINTAPGLEGHTANVYASYMTELKKYLYTASTTPRDIITFDIPARPGAITLAEVNLRDVEDVLVDLEIRNDF